MSHQFIFSGEACNAAGTCITTKVSAPAWLGLVVVSGTIFIGIKIIDTQTSDKESQKKQSG
jgi:hypothetical protein